MEKDFLTWAANGETILFSELLDDIPSDEVLMKLFPYNYDQRPYLSQIGLTIYKLQTDGLSNEEISKRLGLTVRQIQGRVLLVRKKLQAGPMPDYIEIDLPFLRRQRGLNVPITRGCTKLSELMQEMPSDEELRQLFVERGNVVQGRVRILTHEDLILLQKRERGQSNASIARELGVSNELIRRRFVVISILIRKNLGLEIDMPGLLPKR